MSDTVAWICADLWRYVLIGAIILAAGALVAALGWIAVFAVLALRDRIKSAIKRRREEE